MSFASCQTVATAAATAEQNAKDYADSLLAGGVAPSGTAGGDLSGTYPNPTLKAAAVVDAVEAGIAADTGAQAAIAAAIADDIVATGAFQAALATAAPNLKTCAGAAHVAGANVPTCAEMNAAIDAAVGGVTVTGAAVAAAVAADAASQASLATSLADDLVASTAQAQAGTDNTKLISPLRLAEAFQGTNQSFATNVGYQKFPGGLIVQWGTTSGGNVTFPIAFPTKAFRIALTSAEPGVAGYIVTPGDLTATGFAATRSDGVTPAGAGYYIVVGH